MAINRDGGGGFYSQVFFFFHKRGDSSRALRAEMMNTFAVAMPTLCLSLCSQLWAFLIIITHSSRALRNYPQSICTSIWERNRNEEQRGTGIYLHILSRKTLHSFERLTFALRIRTFLLHSFSAYPSHYSLSHLLFKITFHFCLFLNVWPKSPGIGDEFLLVGNVLGANIMPCSVLINWKTRSAIF